MFFYTLHVQKQNTVNVFFLHFSVSYQSPPPPNFFFEI